MATNLVKAGYSVTVFDLNPERMTALVGEGAKGADNVSGLVQSADVIITSLPGPKQVKSLVEGEEGLLSQLQQSSIWIDMTTSDPEFVRELEGQVKVKGASMLDAPVTGAVDGARKGELVYFVGGDRTTFEDCLPLLEVMGRKIFHCGAIGTGNVVKLVTNQLWFINAAAIGEGLLLGVRGGVDALTLWEAIKSSVGNSFVAEHDVPSIFAGHYDPSFTLDLCIKDLNLIDGLGRSLQVPIRLTQRAHEIFEDARVAYGGSSGELHVAKLLEEATGTSLRVEGNWVAPWEA